MITLYQAEWCPHSRAVRRRLTELEVDFVARQVAPEPEDRHDLERIAGTNEIPVLIGEDGSVHAGEDDAIDWLDERYSEGTHAEGHRRQFREHEEELRR